MGKRCTDGSGGAQPSPQIAVLQVGENRAFVSWQNISSPQEPTHGLDKDRGLIKELLEWLFSDK